MHLGAFKMAPVKSMFSTANGATEDNVVVLQLQEGADS